PEEPDTLLNCQANCPKCSDDIQFPLRYFEAHGLKPDWPLFLDDFQRHWPTEDDHAYVDFVREGVMGNGAARTGNARWRLLTEERAGGAKSVFHFDSQWRNPPMLASRGCGSSVNVLGRARISGLSTAGTSPPAGPRSPRSIRRCGAAASRSKGARPISTMPSASLPGLAADRDGTLAGFLTP